jgi:hypothetical protein
MDLFFGLENQSIKVVFTALRIKVSLAIKPSLNDSVHTTPDYRLNLFFHHGTRQQSQLLHGCRRRSWLISCITVHGHQISTNRVLNARVEVSNGAVINVGSFYHDPNIAGSINVRIAGLVLIVN